MKIYEKIWRVINKSLDMVCPPSKNQREEKESSEFCHVPLSPFLEDFVFLSVTEMKTAYE